MCLGPDPVGQRREVVNAEVPEVLWKTHLHPLATHYPNPRASRKIGQQTSPHEASRVHEESLFRVGRVLLQNPPPTGEMLDQRGRDHEAGLSATSLEAEVARPCRVAELGLGTCAPHVIKTPHQVNGWLGPGRFSLHKL